MAEKKKPITTLAQLRKEHKPAKAFTFTVDKDLELIFEDFNYFDDEKHIRIIELLDKMEGNTSSSFKEVVEAVDDLYIEWLGEETYDKLKDKATRTERAQIVGLAGDHFQKLHGADDPKGK